MVACPQNIQIIEEKRRINMTYYEKHKYLQKDTAKKYDEVLPDYYFFDFDSKKYVDERYFLQKYLNNNKFKAAFELGVGTGRMSELIIPHVSEFKGIDFSESMIQKTKKRFKDTNSEFTTISINDFIDKKPNMDNIDFLCSFYAYNYSLLSYFEYYYPETDEHGAYSDKILAEHNAANEIRKLFKLLKPGTKFMFYYFDAYSTEQTYVTHVLEKELPFPYDDRGYTYKLLLHTLKNIKNVDFEVDHKTGYAELKDTTHLLKYYSTLHLAGELNTFEDKVNLFDAFKAFKLSTGEYHIPAGVNIITGNVK